MNDTVQIYEVLKNIKNAFFENYWIVVKSNYP